MTLTALLPTLASTREACEGERGYRAGVGGGRYPRDQAFSQPLCLRPKPSPRKFSQSAPPNLELNFAMKAGLPPSASGGGVRKDGDSERGGGGMRCAIGRGSPCLLQPHIHLLRIQIRLLLKVGHPPLPGGRGSGRDSIPDSNFPSRPPWPPSLPPYASLDHHSVSLIGLLPHRFNTRHTDSPLNHPPPKNSTLQNTKTNDQ